MTEIADILLALVPAIVFLAALVVIDSYKLVKLHSVMFALAAGGLAAIACYFINRNLSLWIALPPREFSRYIGPAVEEIFKSLYLIYLFRARRIGFMVDAAIFGFAIGTGFALVENVYYLRTIAESSMLTWVVRGFGTAAMHGSTVAILGIISRTLSDRWSKESLLVFGPGLAVAIGLHSLFNHFLLPPVLSTALLLLILPVIVGLVFYQSERSTERWLGTGLDADMELLDLIVSGRISQSHIGTYLENLRNHFPDEVVVDMLCYLRLHLELSMQAKGLLLMRQAGLGGSADPELAASFAELKHLEHNIGPTGKLAIKPFLRTGSKDLWQLYMLTEEAARGHTSA